MLINEVKAVSLNIGDTFVMSDSLGKFEKGEEVTVNDIKKSAMDFVIKLSNNKGVTDTFYLDRDDKI